MFAIENNLDAQTPKHIGNYSISDKLSNRKITPQKVQVKPLQEEIKTKMDNEVKTKMEIFNHKIDNFCDDIDKKMDRKIEMVRFDIGNQIFDLSSQMDQMI